MSFIATTLTLFLIQDPIGNIPIFLSVLKASSPQRRLWIVIRENLIALSILIIFLFSGRFILNFFQMTEQGLGITGGIILFIVAFRSIFSPNTAKTPVEKSYREPFIVPLAMPLLAGPACISMITLLSIQYPNQLSLCCLSLLLVAFLSTLILALALSLYTLLSAELLEALEKIMGIILMTLAIQMLLDNSLLYIKNSILFK